MGKGIVQRAGCHRTEQNRTESRARATHCYHAVPCPRPELRGSFDDLTVLVQYKKKLENGSTAVTVMGLFILLLCYIACPAGLVVGHLTFDIWQFPHALRCRRSAYKARQYQ